MNTPDRSAGMGGILIVGVPGLVTMLCATLVLIYPGVRSPQSVTAGSDYCIQIMYAALTIETSS